MICPKTMHSFWSRGWRAVGRTQGYHQISIPVYYNRGSESTVSCIQHENILINDRTKQITTTVHRRRSQILSGDYEEAYRAVYTPRGLGKQCCKLDQWLTVTCGHESGIPPQKLSDWKVGSDEGTDGEVQVRRKSGGTFVCCLYACRYSYAAGQIKMGVRRIPIPEIQAMVVCKNCL